MWINFKALTGSIPRYSLWKPKFKLLPKVPAFKRKWQIEAEKKFLQDRAAFPNDYVQGLKAIHIQPLPPRIQRIMHLRCASLKTLSDYRIRALRQQVGSSLFDKSSLAVKIAELTEKILSIRAHLLRQPQERTSVRAMSIAVGRRHKLMKALYKRDFELYKHVCKMARLKCVRFSIPDSRDRTKAINPIGVDGDRARFLIRQRFWRAHHQPKAIENKRGQKVKPIRHPLANVPANFNGPKRMKCEISRVWPYGVKDERILGSYTIQNPTAPGKFHIPVPLVF